jgi:predicted short-subunit dehydrogenase-like oxidoreductase (DUF2520 family)
MNEPTYGLIGRGRVATHMARYLEFEALPFVNWHREMLSPPEAALASADTILLAISDGAIRPFLADHPELRHRPVVHFSGSLVIDGAHGLHPLMTFGPDLYDLETYRSIPFIEEKSGASFRELFPRLDNPSWPLEPDDKALYHALCVLAGNFTTLLWAKAFEDFERRLGLPPEALLPFMAQTCRNTSTTGRMALTGPLARGDMETVKRDLQALEGDPYARVYRAFAEIFDLEEVTA